MTQERALLAGGCFWGVQDLLRRQEGVISTRVGYSGGEVPNATYRNHGHHAEAVEIIFDTAALTYRDLLEFFFQIHDPSTPQRQGNDRGASYRSAIFYIGEISAQWPRTRSPMSMRPESGLERSSPKWRRRATSGRPNPSIRTIWSATPAATLVISFGQDGSFLGERLPRDSFSSYQTWQSDLSRAHG